MLMEGMDNRKAPRQIMQGEARLSSAEVPGVFPASQFGALVPRALVRALKYQDNTTKTPIARAPTAKTRKKVNSDQVIHNASGVNMPTKPKNTSASSSALSGMVANIFTSMI